MPLTTPTNIWEVNDIRDVAPDRDHWTRLLRRTPGATFFHTLEWLKVYWRHFGGGQRLRVLVVGPADDPIGILPLVERTERRKIGSVRVLTYPLDDWGNHYGPISDRPAETLAAGLPYVLDGPRRWDLLDLRWAPPDDRDANQTAQTLRRLGVKAQRSVRSEIGLVELTGNFDEYLAARTAKHRENHRRWRRKIEKAGQARFLRYRPAGEAVGEADPRFDLYDECVRLAAHSWQSDATDGTTLSDQSIRDFLRDSHAVAARRGALDMNLLYLDDQAIAFAYGYHYQGTCTGLRVGFDPAYGRFSPGNVLYGYVIEDSFARGDKLFDLGPGSLHYKRRLVTRTEPVFQHTYYRPSSVKGQLLASRGRWKDWWDGRVDRQPVATP